MIVVAQTSYFISLFLFLQEANEVIIVVVVVVVVVVNFIKHQNRAITAERVAARVWLC